MPIEISPTIATIAINGHTYTHDDWENNTPGVLGGLGNDLATEISALSLVGTLTKAISGNVTLTGAEGTNLGFVFTGTLTSEATITFAAGFKGPAFIENNTAGGYDIICGLASGLLVRVRYNGSTAAFCDGVDFISQTGIIRRPDGSEAISNLNVGGYISAIGTLFIGNSATITGAGTFNSTLNVVGNATVGGSLTVSGATYIDDNLTVWDEFRVQDKSYFESAVDVAGELSSDRLIVYKTALDGNLYLSSDSGFGSWILFNQGLNNDIRWQMGKTNTLESGDNVGSDLHIVRYSDNEVSLGAPIKIKRSTGVINLSELPTSSAGLVGGDLWNNSGVVNIVL